MQTLTENDAVVTSRRCCGIGGYNLKKTLFYIPSASQGK